MLSTLRISGYEIAEVIHEGINTIVYRAKSHKAKKSVVLKVLKAEYPTLEQINRLKHEYQTTANLDLEEVVKVYGLETHENRLVLVAEDFGGISLKQFLTVNRFPLTFLSTEKKELISTPLEKKGNFTAFLSIAAQVTQALVSLHAYKIIHKDIKPSNIIINPQTRQVKITDFSIASLLNSEMQTDPKQLEGTLAYMSPEQTGRMNRSLDYRSDFYSLGVSFYELLTGQLPFVSDDPLEVVWGHIAKQPTAIRELNPDVPKVVELIVNKLMAKNAEDRYQTATGLLADLQRCLQELTNTSNLKEFTLGEQDKVTQIRTPQKLYGREKQVKKLLTVFERVCQGSCESILVEGFLGVGKSALVDEFINKLMQSSVQEGELKSNQHQAYFISGKFDQLQGNIPYACTAKAWQGFIHRILTESKERITQWREDILTAVGANAQVIIDLIPEVELIIGKQPPIAEVSAAESQNRIVQTFLRFIKVFARPEHPLVIFMDDMQWSDITSLAWWQSIVTDAQMQHLLVIAAYRDNEVNLTHPLTLTIDKIRQSKANIEIITLHPLSLINTTHLIAETLKSSPKAIQSLAKVIHKKTQGNPFFLTQLIKSLYADGLLRFDGKAGWQWDKRIEEQNITNNVVDLMIAKLENLPSATQQVLQFAACIGNEFDLQTLATISTNTHQQTMQYLCKALQEDLIIPLLPNQEFSINLEAGKDALKCNYEQSPSNIETVQVGLRTRLSYPPTISTNPPHPNQQFKFVHNRIQQAIYLLIPETQKHYTHWMIGKLLQQEITADDLETRIFELVNHLNAGLEIVTDIEDKFELAQLNLIAGTKARAVAAYDRALKYFKVGICLVDSQIWNPTTKEKGKGKYELILALYESVTEVAYLCGEFEQMEEFAARTITNAKHPLDCIKVYEVIIQARAVQNKTLEAVNIAVIALNDFGISFPAQPTQNDVTKALESISKKLCDITIEDLISLPQMTNPQYLAAMQILTSVVPASHISTPILAILLILKEVELLLEYGNSPNAALVYASYGLLLNRIQLDIETANKFCQIGLCLAAQSNSQSLKAMTSYLFAAFIQHGKEHVQECLPTFQEVYKNGLVAGNLEFVGYGLRELSHYSYLMGEDLATLVTKIEEYSQILSSLKQERSHQSCLTILQSILNWQGKSPNPCLLVGEACDENQLLPILLATNEIEGLFHFYLRKLILCYGFGNIDQAIEMANQARNYLSAGMSFFSLPSFYFYESLTVLASTQAEKLLAQVTENQTILKNWADSAPMNYQHKYDLVEAEKYRFLGQQYQAMEYYDRAIDAAKENGYIQEVAIANECAGKFYLGLGKSKIAQAYIWEAYHSYLRWGASAKVQQLENKYVYLRDCQGEEAKVKGEFHSTITNATSSTTTSKEVLDLATVIKASQAISSEIVLGKLLYNLLHIILENASAQKGCIILERDNKLFIEVADTNQDASEVILQSVFVDKSEDIPVSIIHYVSRTQKPLLLSNASEIGIFKTDSYILQKQPKSVLCVPILHKNKFIGLVYLENNLATNAFSQERWQIIQVLTSQAAIAIENARLFAIQEEKSQQLAASLEQIAQKEEQYRGIFENTIDALSIYDLEVNSATCKLYGYSFDECLNIQPTDFVHPNSLHLFAEGFNKLKAQQEFCCQAVIIRKDGTLIDVEVKSNAYTYNGKFCSLSVVRDVTERKRAELVLKQQEEQYRGIFENINDGLSIMNLATSDIVTINPAYARMNGYESEEMMTLNPTTYIHPDSHHLFEKCLEQVKSGKDFAAQAKHIHKNGHVFDVEVTATPYTYNGKPHFLAIIRDISENKRVESQLQQNNQELQQAFIKLKQTQSQLVQTEKISQLGQLVAGVAHEVNNPVGFISGNLSHAKQYVEDLINLIKLYQVIYPNPSGAIADEIEAIDLPYLMEDLPKMITSMKLGTDRIRDIMQSLRNFSRSDTSEKREIDIHQSIDTTLIVLSHRLKAKPERPAIQVIKEYGDVPLIPCFSGQINQVLMNLLANAIDALDESNAGKSYFEVETNPNIIKISTSVEPYQVTIKIADNGLGMPEDVRAKLFDAFFTTKSEGKGTGLGLSISYQIITEAHNGTLECFSSPGNGAEFVIKLKL
jgi:PAS domain S-box-containing protein